MSFGVYVHIPFCSKRCDYCAFATWTDRAHLIDDYVSAVRTELERAELPPASTVFFGGGTPSLIGGDRIAAILDSIERTDDAETTIECNPDNVTDELATRLAQAGVNRISMGVQSMVSHVLQSLGREHDAGAVRSAVRSIAAAGIERVNVDIIYGAKGESLDDWKRTLDSVLSLDPLPSHVSAYGLTVEPGTPLARDAARHPDDDDQADKYFVTEERLVAAGFRNYEISNWAFPGDECRHNILYWQQGNYRGVGCAAHSHENGRRWWNIRTPDRYISVVGKDESVMAGEEVLDEATKNFERLELALRMRDGVPARYLDVEGLDEFVEVVDGRARLTVKGRLMANQIALRLKADEPGVGTAA